MMIHLTPCGGLGNRIRAVSSVYDFARKNDFALKVYWMLESGYNCSYYSIFEKVEGLNVDDRGLINFFLHNLPCSNNFYLPGIVDKLTGRTVIDHLDASSINQAKSADIYLTTCYQQGELYPIKELFVPKESVRKIIDDIVSSFSPNTYGIHIRRTDNAPSIEVSSIGIFENAIIQKLEAEPDTRFFLCTDDKQTKEYLQRKFGHRMITYHSILKRNSKQGIMDAVIELWSLACTKEIWGSYYSSYSEIASSINGIKLKVAGKDDLTSVSDFRF